MGKRLTIDCGNTAVKVAVWDGDDVFVCQALIHEDLEKALRDLYKIHGQFEASIFCAVKDVNPELISTLNDVSAKVYKLDAGLPLPIAINYGTPGTLGPDRIAAAVGATDITSGGWRLVIDMGTAVTYDIVSPENVFAGGNIAPGLKMRIQSLAAFTARLPEVPLDGPCPEFGYDTDTAIRSGAIRGILGEISYFVSLLPEPRNIIVTGGRIKYFTPYLNPKFIIYPHLVTKGLNSIITYNENLEHA